MTRAFLLGIDELLILHLEAGFAQQAGRLAQIVANGILIAVHRGDVGFGEDFGRHLVAHRLQNLELQSLW